MASTSLMNISPIDGRYAAQTEPLRSIFSEYGLLARRTHVEIEWFKTLNDVLPDQTGLSITANARLAELDIDFDVEAAAAIKAIEKTTNHDVKAVEYYLRDKLSDDTEMANKTSLLHFACTSEDINNLAYGLMLKDAREQVLRPTLAALLTDLLDLVTCYCDQPMLSRTHGQPASPTTLGKEIANVCARLDRQMELFTNVKLLGKINGAVGNYNAHVASYPDLDWPQIAEQFVGRIGLDYNPLTTQIEPHDYLAELFSALVRINVILIDFCRDVWAYISIGYFTQRSVSNEVGSSTMPHKVNPIDFENAEGNLGIANALLEHLSQKLPVSRWQRDLTDSTSLRNIGVALAHCLLAYDAVIRGVNKLEVNTERLRQDLETNWEILAEPIQTVMRRHGITDSYEQLKSLTRGKRLDRTTLLEFIDTLSLPDDAKSALKSLTPATYTGHASSQASALVTALKGRTR